MKKINLNKVFPPKFVLEFRAKLPGNKYFYQKNQYLTSFLRRVLMFWKVSHPTYLSEELEDKLEIKISNKWVKCSAPKLKYKSPDMYSLP